MIVPMYKYAFLVYHRDFEEFLVKLQELGMVDIVRQTRQFADSERSLISQVTKLTNVARELKMRAAVESTGETLDSNAVIAEFDSLLKEKEQVENAIRKAQKELNDVRPWGQFDISLIKSLSDSGLRIRFFNIGEKSFNDAWLEEYPIEVIHREAGQVFFVCIQKTDIEIPHEAVELKAPSFSFTEKDAEIVKFKSRLSSIESRLNQLAEFVDQLEKEKVDLINQLEFSAVKQSAEKQANETLMVLQGWVPEPKNDLFLEFIEKESLIYMSEKAKRTDDAPILLKNNKFSKLFEPIGSLFTSPTYGELDLTPLFAPFFMMFFGFCLGDAGYGLVLLVGASLYKLKAKKEFRPILSLVQFFSISTVLFGVLTGTLFGVALVDLQVPFLDSYREHFLDTKQLFALALIIGFLQIIFGMFVKAANQIKQFGWMYSISTFGWILLIVGSLAFYGLSKWNAVSVELFGIGHKILLGVAGIGIFFFNSPRKNPFINFGLGLWDSYNMITGMFGDVLSYIRLFALGLSSSILGNVFNSLAFGMAPDIPVVGAIVTIIILVAGHSINLFMGALGALVHPMRLTFVEFYKNAGFTGGGKMYQPFQKQ